MRIGRQTMLGVLSCGLLLVGTNAAADWREQVPVYRYGVASTENEADRVRRYDCIRDVLETKLGVPVELYQATSYSGIIQAFLSGQLEQARVGGASYAAMHIQDPDIVEPAFLALEEDGSIGYRSVLWVRAGSPLQTLEDLEGKSLAFSDPNSTSGYLVPTFELSRAGKTPESFFGRTGFSGGHEQSVVAVLNGQYDAAVTNVSGVGDFDAGFSTGTMRRMVDKGMLDMSDVRILWTSELIPGSVNVLRSALPAELKYLVRGIFLALPSENPACFESIIGGKPKGYVSATHDMYARLIEMRESVRDARRRPR